MESQNTATAETLFPPVISISTSIIRGHAQQCAREPLPCQICLFSVPL